MAYLLRGSEDLRQVIIGGSFEFGIRRNSPTSAKSPSDASIEMHSPMVSVNHFPWVYDHFMRSTDFR